MPTSAKRIKPETEVKEKFLTFYKSIFLRRHVNGIQQTIVICRPDVREKVTKGFQSENKFFSD
jgi:hypothetical protein